MDNPIVHLHRYLTKLQDEYLIEKANRRKLKRELARMKKRQEANKLSIVKEETGCGDFEALFKIKYGGINGEK